MKTEAMKTLVEQMPEYKSHKIVKALQIEDLIIEHGTSDYPKTTMSFVEEEFDSIEIDKEYVDRHKPKVGGYFVVYEDGYTSYSPQEAFESGYTLIE